MVARKKAPAKRTKSAKPVPPQAPGSKRPLSVQQQRFVDLYAAGGFSNQAQAYIEAGYQVTSRTSASACAARLLAYANVAAAVQVARDRLTKKLEISQERVLSELVAMAFYDPADLVQPDPDRPGQFLNINSPADIRKLPEHIRRCIVGWSWDRNGNFTLKLADKLRAGEMIGRHLAMFIDRKEVKVGELERASDDELHARMAQAARQIAEIEGVPVETVLKQVREGGANTVH